MNKNIIGFKARLASIEATVYLERSIQISENPVIKMTRENIEVSYQEETLKTKGIQLNINATGGGENLEHSIIWDKLQSYAPKSSFKLPVISIIE